MSSKLDSYRVSQLLHACSKQAEQNLHATSYPISKTMNQSSKDDSYTAFVTKDYEYAIALRLDSFPLCSFLRLRRVCCDQEIPDSSFNSHALLRAPSLNIGHPRFLRVLEEAWICISSAFAPPLPSKRSTFFTSTGHTVRSLVPFSVIW